MGTNSRMRYGFGDFDLGELGSDPSLMVSPPAATVGDLITAQNARTAALTNVDPITALASKVQAIPPTTLLLFVGGAVALVLLSSPSSGRRR
jgi:hypothetical protein